MSDDRRYFTRQLEQYRKFFAFQRHASNYQTGSGYRLVLLSSYLLSLLFRLHSTEESPGVPSWHWPEFSVSGNIFSGGSNDGMKSPVPLMRAIRILCPLTSSAITRKWRLNGGVGQIPGAGVFRSMVSRLLAAHARWHGHHYVHR
ncbi:hypothetical protein RRG08_016151 [Elysia crispata]|uniref:Uncharacterized protein n=1 Tax=Elysia crispata TaxID=231223 RepID=A0AAE0Z2K0_9GAST|nr:hypothetical protein RRG08_016151 [Elysia crispata]